MALKRNVVTVLIGIGLAALAISAGAQSGTKYKVRLSPAPPLTSRGANMTANAAAVVGSGNAEATLNGKKLSVTGTFEKLASSATAARIFMGPAMGARAYPGMSFGEFPVMKQADGKSGSFSGSVDLTTDQVEALKKGRLYIQIHSEKAPDGNLWGWLLPQENRR